MRLIDILSQAGLEGLIPPNVNMPQGDIQAPQQHMGKQLLEYLAGNTMGQPSGEWVNPERQPGSERPGIYAPPKNEWVHSVFAGQKAKKAPLALLEDARMMRNLNPSQRNEMWNKTGWMRGAEEKWRFEIDDSAAKLKNLRADSLGTVDRNTYLGDILDHKELYDNYPEIDNTIVKILIDSEAVSPRGSFKGRVDRSGEGLFDLEPEISIVARNQKEAKETLMHEIQHFVQTKEGFLPGSTPAREMEGSQIKSVLERLGNEFSTLKGKGVDFRTGVENKRFLELRDSILPSLTREYNKIAFQKYSASPGEIEANEVISRMAMSGPQRQEGMSSVVSDILKARAKLQ